MPIAADRSVSPLIGNTVAQSFTPQLVTVLREGYNLAHLRADAIAGLTVAIVALPLSMAIAIASGASPAQGLYTAIVGGFLVSALGGSRFQIGGPAGAFIVLILATVNAHGIDGLILATIVSGILLTLVGTLQLGSYIKFIPYPVTVGFTAGIAVIIFASQLKELMGLELIGPEPGPLIEKLPVLWQSLSSFTPAAVALSLTSVLVIVGIKRVRPSWPGMLIAVVIGALAATSLGLPVSTIGTAFGGIPATLPLPTLPEVSWEKVLAVMPSAIAFTLLGSIESLLSALVADSMTGTRYRSNSELVAQGIANIGSGLFGGFCVTGTIARTATNIRAGAHGPLAGMLHALFLLLFMLLAAPLASYIPLASLAGVLAVVAWNMIEKQAFIALLRASRGDAAVLLVTFLLTIFRELTEAIVVGFLLGSVLFIHRLSQTTAIERQFPVTRRHANGAEPGEQISYDESSASDPDIVIYRISGAFFFGAAASIGVVLDRIASTHRALIIDLSQVPLLDSTGANTIEMLAHKASRRGVKVALTGTTRKTREELFALGIKPPLVRYEISVERAVNKLHKSLGSGPAGQP